MSSSTLYAISASPSPSGPYSTNQPLHPNVSTSYRPLPQPPCRVPVSTLHPKPRPLPIPPVTTTLQHPNDSQTFFQSTDSMPSTSYSDSDSVSLHTSNSTNLSERSLHLEIPTFQPLEVHIRSPSSPASPLIFTFPPMSPELFKKRESALAERMSKLGFIEELQLCTTPLQLSSRYDEKGASMETSTSQHDVVLLLDLQDKQGEATIGGAGNFVGAHDLGGRTSNAKRRFSRKWIREKKGERWVEEDYQEILRELRKLR